MAGSGGVERVVFSTLHVQYLRENRFGILPEAAQVVGMNELETVRQDLVRYLEAVEATRAKRPAELSQAMYALEAHSKNPSPSLPAPLRHYLESRSYRKAWEWIQGQTPAKGSCGN